MANDMNDIASRLADLDKEEVRKLAEMTVDEIGRLLDNEDFDRDLASVALTAWRVGLDLPKGAEILAKMERVTRVSRLRNALPDGASITVEGNDESILTSAEAVEALASHPDGELLRKARALCAHLEDIGYDVALVATPNGRVADWFASRFHETGEIPKGSECPLLPLAFIFSNDQIRMARDLSFVIARVSMKVLMNEALAKGEGEGGGAS